MAGSSVLTGSSSNPSGGNKTIASTASNGTLNNLMASSIAAIVSRLCTHPLDTLKTRVQASSKPLPLLPTFISLVRDGGLYRGLPIALTLSAPGLSVYLAAYDFSKDKFSRHFSFLGKESIFNHFASAAIAETFSGLFWTPMEVLKSKQQVEIVKLISPTTATASKPLNLATAQAPLPKSHAPISTMELAGKIYKQEGLIGFFRGYFITLGVFVPYSMIYFATYEQLKELAWQRRRVKTPSNVKNGETLPFLTIASCAALATGIAGGASNVVDVVKTRWQISVLATTEENSSTRKIVSHMFRQGGLTSFTQGMGARVLWMIPSVTISMSTYEWLKANGFT
ncbi:hypothetical protein BGX27_001012 [Mortierella sp. AM989]|nr:hypothetical protein BGX27_001012 [Mortierella sp. AM989]